MPLIATRGAASAQGFGEFAQSAAPVYIEDVFSTYLYTGNGSTQTITNGIDLSGEGGLVWIKNRTNANSHFLFDSERSNFTARLITNGTQSSFVDTAASLTVSSTGFSLASSPDNNTGGSGFNYTSWTFREQPKFYDIVTYTGNGSAPRNISHNLDSSPGFIIIKRTDSTGDWWCWHRSIANKNIYLNYTDAADSGANPMISAVSSTNFTLATNQNATMNINGATYVAFLFAHDAGGFGLTGSDNVITCGSFTTNGTGQATVTLNYEPQWLLLKPSSTTGNWLMVDTMRGWNVNATGNIQRLRANLPDAEDLGGQLNPTATGFQTSASGALVASHTYIYIAVRRGPMKTPTSGTSVFTPVIGTSSQSSPEYLAFNAGFPIDLSIIKDKANVGDNYAGTRLTGRQRSLIPNATSIETTDTINTYDNQSGLGFTTSYNVSTWIGWLFRRAPGFFDVVCYTGTGSARTVSHNLGVVPELMIVKSRTTTDPWPVYHVATGNNGVSFLNSTSATSSDNEWNYTTPTSLVFSVGPGDKVNGLSQNYVAYLFASVAGVSKVGSYTGTGTTLQVNCGFTNGSRFVLIKRTNSTGDWYVWDSARGIVAGNDPYLLLNSSAAEVTNTDYVDTYSAGFEISSTAPAAINANGGTFIFLAVA